MSSLIKLLVVTVFFSFISISHAANWWDSNWNYRASLTVNSGDYERFNKPAEIAINFSDYLSPDDASTAFDLNSIRVHEVDTSGQIISENISYQFDPAVDFNALTKADGILIFLLSNNTTAQTERYFQVYFDVEGGAYVSPTFTSQVDVTDNISDEGQDSFLISTNSADYNYQKISGGFSSIVDSNGNDWLNYHPSGGSAGNFRGIPNLVPPWDGGHFHPGTTTSISTLIHQGSLKATIQSVTTDGLWEVQWEFFPQFARMSVILADKNFWFLYEGTPGGLLDANDFVVRPDGTETAYTAGWNGDLSPQEWVYFTDTQVGKSIFLAHHEDDNAVDSYRQKDNQMTVFGFGRDGSESLIDKQQPHHFTIGLTDTTDFGNTSATLLSAYKDINVIISSIDQNTNTPDTESPTSPENLTAQPTATQVNLNWTAATDNVGVALYRISIDGTETGTTATTSFQATGLNAGQSYSFSVIAEDASGNQSTAATVSATTLTTSDTTAPSVPTGLTLNSATANAVSISWTASIDTQGTVVLYHIMRNGSEIATSAIASYTDNTVASETTYVYTITAEDNAGNESDVSTDLSVDTPAVPTTTGPQLIAGYPFEEGSGSIVVDLSGNGNNGTLTGGAIRNLSGETGEAIEFNGIDSAINLGAMDITTPAMSIALWFKPDDFGISDARLISKANGTSSAAHYWMISTISQGGQNRLRFRLKTENGGTSTLIGSAALIPGVWTHVTATYDGINMKLFQNSIEVGSFAKTGAISTSSSVEAWIGANPGNTRYFDGLIDDVRLYGEALDGATIQDIIAGNLPLIDGGGNTPDTESPTSPENLTAQPTATQVNLNWTAATDNVGVALYRISIDGTETGTTATTSFQATGLNAGQSYSFSVIAEDASGNQSTAATVSATTLTTSDTTAPSVPTGLTLNSATANAVSISWTASIDTQGTVVLYHIMRNGSEIATSAIASYTDNTVASETTYVYTITAEDNAGNESDVSTDLSVDTPAVPTTTGPQLIAGYPFEEGSGSIVVDLSGNGNNGTLTGGAIRNLSGETGEAIEFNGIDSAINLGAMDITTPAMSIALWFKPDDFGISDARLISKANGTSSAAHYWMISTISQGGQNRLRFRLKTENGGTSTLIGSAALIPGVWTHVTATYDGINMKLFQNSIEVGSFAKTGAISTSSSVEAWIGANPGNTRYFDGLIDDVRLYGEALDGATIQDIIAGNLPLIDGGGNNTDTESPTSPENLTAQPTATQVNLNWTAATDNVGVALYRISIDGTETGTTATTSFQATGLNAGQSYSFSVIAEDASGNQSTAATVSATTLTTSDTTAPSVPTGLTLNSATANAVSISWTASIDTQGTVVLYHIMRNGSEIATSAIASYTDNTVASETTYVYTITAEDNAGNESDVSTDLSVDTPAVPTTTGPQLIAGYPFEEGSGSIVVDLSGNGNNGTLTGGAIRNLSGETGEAIEFNGIDSAINLGAMDITTPAMSIALWFKPDDFGISDARLISKANGTSSAAHYWMISTISQGGQNRLRFRLKTENGGTSTLIGSAALIPGVWTHVTATYDGINMKLFQNSIEVGSFAKTGAISTSSSVEAWIGANPSNTTYFDGLIDEVRIYGEALNELTIQDIFQGNLPIDGDNQSPTVSDDEYSFAENTILNIDVSGGVLANDFDPDLDAIQALLFTDVSNGSLNLNTDGSFIYTPNQDFSGIDSFVYRASDGLRQSDLATVLITVTGDNNAPIANNDQYQTHPNNLLVVSAGQGVLVNDNDPELDILQAILISTVSNGTLSLNSNGSFEYSPNQGFIGTDNFTYKTSDGSNQSNIAIVNIEVVIANSPPKIQTGSVSFTKQILDTTVRQTHKAVGADLDGDSDIDVVATDFINDSIYWYENEGEGTFTKHVLDNALEGSYPVHVADLDLDGDIDILATGYKADTVVWYENNGGALFTRHEIDTQADGAHSVITGDVDGDGDIDLLTTNQDADTIHIYENDGFQNFSLSVIDTEADGAKYAEFSDLDNDGDIDIIAASFFNDQIAWYENDGNENFTKNIIDNNVNGAYYVSVSDINDDGLKDILTASQLDNTVAWYKNEGANGFSKQIIDNSATGARSVIASDVDGDGDYDVIASIRLDNTIAWYKNDGNGNFVKNTIDTSALGAYGISAIDMNNDGNIDIISASRNANEVAVHSQLRTHEIPLNIGSSILIDSSQLLTVDTDDGPDDLIYSLTSSAVSGTIELNEVALSINNTFTQSDVNNGFVSYHHNGVSLNGDTITFTVVDGGEDGVEASTGNLIFVISP